MALKGKIDVDPLHCKGCSLCVETCPQNVIALDMEHLTPRGYHPARLIADHCTGCGVCSVVCPDAAITVYREVRKKKVFA